MHTYKDKEAKKQAAKQRKGRKEKLKAIEKYLNQNTSVVCCEDDCIIWAAF